MKNIKALYKLTDQLSDKTADLYQTEQLIEEHLDSIRRGASQSNYYPDALIRKRSKKMRQIEAIEKITKEIKSITKQIKKDANR